ncbi:TetR/AcrR family transcriptional regulator [Sphaerochaeta sp.]|uniref:TetR/AcrR family transcriptional regulator n=1 Tax=Sphaerochaeta sp. TaxID=1972642 RepID=UPI002FC6FA6B
MPTTKETILQTALRLFAQEGYEATSVSAIATQLGMTKGALYKHYKNKQDIFDHIVERVYTLDAQNAKHHGVPEEPYAQSPQAYRSTTLEAVQVFMEAQFRIWTEDEFFNNFRRMLILEQYRNPKMMELYQTCLVSGPVEYVEDLFREMQAQGTITEDPRQLAIELYAPFYLLLSISDAKTDTQATTRQLKIQIKRFLENRNVLNQPKQEGV